MYKIYFCCKGLIKEGQLHNDLIANPIKLIPSAPRHTVSHLLTHKSPYTLRHCTPAVQWRPSPRERAYPRPHPHPELEGSALSTLAVFGVELSVEFVFWEHFSTQPTTLHFAPRGAGAGGTDTAAGGPPAPLWSTGTFPRPHGYGQGHARGATC